MSLNLNIWSVFWTNQAQMGHNAIGRWQAGGGLQVPSGPFNASDFQLEYARDLHDTLFVPVIMYGSETMLWREKARSRVKAVQMDNLRRLLGIRRMDRVPNVRIREFCGVRKGVDERIDEGVLRLRGWRSIESPRESM